MKKSVIFLFLISLALILYGCNNKDPLPEDRFNEYISLWNEQDFEQMYDYLSTESKEQISKQDFVDRYTKIYQDLEISNLQIQFNDPEEETDIKEIEDILFPFQASMDSIAGKIEFQHEATLVKEEREEENNWYLHWDSTFIFPELEEGDTVTLSTISPERGNLYDRNGLPLTETGEVREIGLVPEKIEGPVEDTIRKVADLLGISEERVERELNASWVQPDYFVPLKMIPLDDTELRAKLGEIPGVQGRNMDARLYPFGEAAGLLTGNIAAVTAEDIEKHPDKGYKSNDMIGRRGLELVLEDRLRGEAGIKIVINKEDREVVLAEKEVKHGEDIQLTIDVILQTVIYEQLEGRAGTAAAIHPLTGEVLALVSSPSFDPNILAIGATNEQLAQWEKDENHPFLIRFNSTYAPGSVMKPITAAIALNENAIDWNQTMDVKGLTWAKDNWVDYRVKRVSDYGVPVDLEKAMIYSDNIFFAQAALELGQDRFIEGLKKFGFDEEIPFLFPMQPSTYGQIDSEAALADSGYGQAQIELSVLHLAATYTPFLNKGNMIKPILESAEEKGQIWKENLISEEDANRLHESMIKVIEDPRGTARGAKIEGYPLAGKTGTAEYEKAAQGEQGKTNGWFVAYNTENPELLIALMIEEASSGLAVEKVKSSIEEYQALFRREE